MTSPKTSKGSKPVKTLDDVVKAIEWCGFILGVLIWLCTICIAGAITTQ